MKVFDNNKMKIVERAPWNKDELFNHVKAGGKNAFEQLYRDHSGGIYCNLRMLTRNDELAKELLQDVFLKVWEKKALLNPDKAFHFYLFRIARNSVTDFYWKVKRDKHILQIFSYLLQKLLISQLKVLSQERMKSYCFWRWTFFAKKENIYSLQTGILKK